MTQDPFGYAGKRVVVSGCFSGIGQAVARLLVSYGAEVHGLDWQRSELDLHAFDLVDLRDRTTIDAAVGRIGGRVQALFNCAGVAPGRPPLDVMMVNFIGTQHLTRGLLPLMPVGAAIANVASTSGMGWSRNRSALLQLVDAGSWDAALRWCAGNAQLLAEGYRLSKEAIIVWTMRDAARLIRQGIRINCTIPGAVQTPMLVEIEKSTPSATIDIVAQPIGRRSQPDEQALPLLLLNSPLASYVNGTAMPIDGGFAAGAMLATSNA